MSSTSLKRKKRQTKKNGDNELPLPQEPQDQQQDTEIKEIENEDNIVITNSNTTPPITRRQRKVIYSFEDEEEKEINNNSTTKGDIEIDDEEEEYEDDDIIVVEDDDSNSKNKNKNKKQKTTALSQPKPTKKASSKRGPKNKTPPNNTLLNFLDPPPPPPPLSTITSNTTIPTTTSTTATIIASPISPQSSSDNDSSKPVHPFFSKKEKKEKKEKVSLLDDPMFKDKLINSGAPVADLFLSKKEKDEIFTAKQQEKHRLDILKSIEDHEKILHGKPMHPFFFAPPPTSSSLPTSDNNNNNSNNNTIDSDNDNIPTTTIVKYQIQRLVEFPIEEDQHIGWYNIKDDKSITYCIQAPNKQLLNKFKRSKLKISSSFDYDNLVLASNELIPNFDKILQKIEQLLPQSQSSFNSSITPNSTQTPSTPIPVITDSQQQQQPIIDNDNQDTIFENIFNTINNNKVTSIDDIQIPKSIEELKLLYNQFITNLTNSSNNNNSLLSNRYYLSLNQLSIFNNKNYEVLSFFDQWISLWKNKLERKVNKTSSGKLRKSKDNSNSKKEDIIKSSILIVGPFGCGKSSIVSTKSKQYNFTILETNPSCKRNGKQIIELLGEATQSKALNIVNLKDTPPLPSIIPSQDTQIVKKGRGRKQLTNSDEQQQQQIVNKNLILFEEIDILYEDDRGFNNSVSSLLSSTKVPIVMICNELNSSISKLVQDSGIITLYMAKPSSWSLSLYCYFILFKESINNCNNNNNNQLYQLLLNNSNLSSLDLNSFIINNNIDIRSCLNNLEFILIGFGNSGVTLTFYMFENLFKKYNNNYLNLLFKVLPQQKDNEEIIQEDDNDQENEQEEEYELFNDKFKLLNTSLVEFDIDLYFNNYLEFISNNSSDNDGDNDEFESIWELSENFSTNDILLSIKKQHPPYEPIIGEDDQLYEIIDNSPTFILQQDSLHYYDYSYRNYYSKPLDFDIPTCISIKSMDNYLIKRQQQSNSNNSNNNIDFKFNILKIQDQYKIIERTNIEENHYQDIKDQISLKLHSFITTSKMFVEFTPWLIEICKSEQNRKLLNPKRGNRFTHYLDFTDNQIDILFKFNIINN